jgi:6-phosphogluconolactonase
MKIEIMADADSVARKAASFFAAECREVVHCRGQFIVAVSGGRTPWHMFRYLTLEDIPWEKVDIFQVDERVAPAGHSNRNLTHLLESLKDTPLRPEQLHAMPVDTPNLETAVQHYSTNLEEIAGSPAVLDLVHLGLGSDGHTASLVPGDEVLEVHNTDVALTGMYQGRRRITLTYPVLNRARRLLWLVTGSDKAESLVKLYQGDISIPAGRVNQEHSVLFADMSATEKLDYPKKEN